MDILTILLLTCSTGVIAAIFLILYLDKIFFLVGVLLNLFSFIKVIRKKSYALQTQGKINDICKNMSPEIFDKPLKIRWTEAYRKEHKKTDKK